MLTVLLRLVRVIVVNKSNMFLISWLIYNVLTLPDVPAMFFNELRGKHSYAFDVMIHIDTILSVVPFFVDLCLPVTNVQRGAQ